MSSFSVTTVTNCSGSRTSNSRRSAGPSNEVPSGSVPDASIAVPPGMCERQRPTASKFSSANPSGSITRWQLAQTGFARCCAIRSRIASTLSAPSAGSSSGTFGGGGGGGVPSTFSSTHFPRPTGEVRSGYEVTVRMLPWPSKPRRLPSASATRPEVAAGHALDAVVPGQPLVEERGSRPSAAR